MDKHVVGTDRGREESERVLRRKMCEVNLMVVLSSEMSGFYKIFDLCADLYLGTEISSIKSHFRTWVRK
jgi:hypothetical protein